MTQAAAILAAPRPACDAITAQVRETDLDTTNRDTVYATDGDTVYATDRDTGHAGPTLYLPGGPNGKAFFSLPALNRRVTAELPPAEARLVLLLDRAYEADADLPPEAQGWRSIEQLVALVELETKYALDSQTISQYLWRIKREFDKAAAAMGDIEAPAWREVNRGAGMRLVARPKVIDGTKRFTSRSAVDRPQRTNGGVVVDVNVDADADVVVDCVVDAAAENAEHGIAEPQRRLS